VKVPRSFTLAGITWRVEETDAISDMGHCDSETATIRIRRSLSRQLKEATFCHELQHAIRFTSGQTDHDERDVDAHGNLLHQFLNTAKYHGEQND
jgi:hypothetical protein